MTKFNGRNDAHRANKMVPHLKQKQVNGIINGYDDKTEETAANATATAQATF